MPATAPRPSRLPKTALLAALRLLPKPRMDVMVYASPQGGRYHSFHCPSIKDDRIPMRLSEARAEGREPCKRCQPGPGGMKTTTQQP